MLAKDQVPAQRNNSIAQCLKQQCLRFSQTFSDETGTSSTAHITDAVQAKFLHWTLKYGADSMPIDKAV